MHHVIVPEAQHATTPGRQPRRPDSIALAIGVLATVDLYRKLVSLGEEIDHIRTKRMLTAKFHTA